MKRVRVSVAWIAVVLVTAAGFSAAPNTGRRVAFDSVELASRAHALEVRERITITDLPMHRGGGLTELELRKVEVFAPDARIVVHTARGPVDVAPPNEVYLSGTVAGEPRSTAFVAVRNTGRVRGILTLPEGMVYWGADGLGDHTVELIDETTAKQSGEPWTCAADQLPPVPAEALPPMRDATGRSDTAYRAHLAIETDYEYYQIFGNSNDATSYIATVFGTGSSIYQRDINTELQVDHVSLWSTSSDPWTATDSIGVLIEFGDYWHANNSGISRDLAHFLSGKGLGGGVSWTPGLCQSDWYSPTYGGWGGGYGVCGNIDGNYDPGNPSPYIRWDLICTTHEIGHNFSTHHTHCYNDYPNSGDPPVDECYSGETGCYSGPTSLPTDGGTIMSYCHLLSGGYANINLWFGRVGHYGINSERVPAKMRSYVETYANPPSCLTEVPSGPITGDADGDLDVDGADIAMTVQEIFDLDGRSTADMCDAGPCPEPEIDGDGNSLIETADIAVQIEAATDV